MEEKSEELLNQFSEWCTIFISTCIFSLHFMIFEGSTFFSVLWELRQSNNIIYYLLPVDDMRGMFILAKHGLGPCSVMYGHSVRFCHSHDNTVHTLA